MEVVQLLDDQGYRFNVGIVVVNDDGLLLWARRKNQKSAWQFPQGGIKQGESPKQAMFRELREELGLLPEHVEIIYELPDWYFYQLPRKFQRLHQKPLCVGQKQRWFFLRMLSDDDQVNLLQSPEPEFCEWKWVEPHLPPKQVIDFKSKVYSDILREFGRFLSNRT